MAVTPTEQPCTESAGADNSRWGQEAPGCIPAPQHLPQGGCDHPLPRNVRLILLSTQSPCTGSQVPREHWQGEEQFTPKYPSGQVLLQLEERGKEGNDPRASEAPAQPHSQRYPSIFLVLPVSPVACLADASSCHRVTAPRNTLGAEELAAITKGAHWAGGVAAAKTEQSFSDCTPDRDTPGTRGLTLGIPGPCPARVTVQAGPSLGVTGLPMLAAGTRLEAAIPMESRSTGILAEGPIPARLAGQAETIHR